MVPSQLWRRTEAGGVPTIVEDAIIQQTICKWSLERVPPLSIEHKLEMHFLKNIFHFFRILDINV